MAEINLYPEKQRQSISWYKFSQAFKTINFVVTVIFFVTALIIVAFIILNQNAINQAKAEEDDYRSKLKALSDVEYQYMFIKDRAAKADEILKTRKVVKNLEDVNSIMQKVGDVNLTEVQLEKSKLSITATVPTFSSLKTFISEIKSLKSYQKGMIDSLSFSPDKGYSLQINFQ
jgi:hypothetical protein